MWLPSAIFNTCIDIFDRTFKAYDLIKSTHRRNIVWWLQKCKAVASHCKVRQSHTVHITKYIWISIFSMCSSMAIMYLVWRGQYPLLGQSQCLSLPGSLQSLASLYLSPGPAPLLWWSIGLEGHPPSRYMTFFFIAKISTDNKMSANMSPMFSANKSLTSLQNIIVLNLDLLPSPFLARHVCSLRGIDRYKW